MKRPGWCSEVELHIGFVRELDAATMLVLSDNFDKLLILNLLRALAGDCFEDRERLCAAQRVSNMQHLFVSHVRLLACELLKRRSA